MDEVVLKSVLKLIEFEIRKASTKFPPFNTAHEGYAIILEELDELWDAIRYDKSFEEQVKEAVQVAAMAARFIHDLYPPYAEKWRSE